MVSFLSVVVVVVFFFNLVSFASEPRYFGLAESDDTSVKRQSISLIYTRKNFRNCFMFRANQKYEERKAKRTLRISGISFEKEGELF